MNQADAVTTLAEKAWAHRKQFGYLKSLPKEIQIEAVEVARSGKSPTVIARALGVTKKTIRDWGEKYKPAESVADFREVPLVGVASASPLEVRVVALVNGAKIEITCSSFESVQAILKMLGS